MSGAVIAFLVAISGATWTFTKLQNRAGYGNNRPAIISAVLVFAVIFIVILTLSQMIS